MAKSVFLTRKAEIMRAKHITKLLLHLRSPELQPPLDVMAHIQKLPPKAMMLAVAVKEAYERGDPEIHRYAEALSINYR